MALGNTRTLTDKVFNSMLFQECVAAEEYFAAESLNGVAPTVLRAVFLTEEIGTAPFVQTLPIENVDTQPGVIAEAAEAVDPKFDLVALLYMTSIKYTDPNSDESVLKMVISGATPDGRRNLAVYVYDTDEDGRYYINQETVIPYTPESDIETEVPAIDAYLKAYTKHRLMLK